MLKLTFYNFKVSVFVCRSEGLPERDMESLGVMGGLVVAEKSSAVVVVAVAVVALGRGGRAGAVEGPCL